MKKQNVRTLSFIVSTFTYLLVGAAIFDALESQAEEYATKIIENNTTSLMNKYNITDDDYHELELLVKDFHQFKTHTQWEFLGAFYFSLTVITTIGYGHSTPHTLQGKLFCMLYAMIGIPLCLVMFQSVGERLNNFTLFCIKFVKKCFRKNDENNQTELVFVGVMLVIVVIFGGAALFQSYEKWSYFDSIYYCVVTLTTIGFGDFVALQGKDDQNNVSNPGYVILAFVFLLFGLAVVASSMNLLVLRLLTMNTADERREEFSREVQRHHSLRISDADLLNVVSGNVICTFEQSDLDDLKNENNFFINFPSKSKFYSFFRSKLFSSSNTNEIEKSAELTKTTSNGIDKTYNYETSSSFDNTAQVNQKSSFFKCCLSSNPISSETSTIIYNVKGNKENLVYINGNDYLCRKDFMKSKIFSPKPKKHYTVRRGPGKISHLLPLQRLDSLVLNIKNDENFDKRNDSNSSVPNNIVVKTSSTLTRRINNNVNKT